MDSVLNDFLHIVTGCLYSIPTEHVSILSGIKSVKLFQLKAELSLTNSKTLNFEHQVISRNIKFLRCQNLVVWLKCLILFNEMTKI